MYKRGEKGEDEIRITMLETPIGERVKQLIIFAKNPDEVDIIAEAYRKLEEVRKERR